MKCMVNTQKFSRKFSMETFWTPSFSVQEQQKTVTTPSSTLCLSYLGSITYRDNFTFIDSTSQLYSTFDSSHS